MTASTIKRCATALIGLVASVTMVAGCTPTDTSSSPAGLEEPGGASVPGGTLSIVAATELEDLEPVIGQASAELGFEIELVYPGGTLENSRQLAAGAYDDEYDATWFATNRYVDLLGASGKLIESTGIATSPVAFGIDSAKATELGWDSSQPTWEEIADSAAAGDFLFGMTDPSTSNSGFSALVSVATAMADTGSALTEADISRVSPRLQDFFGGQSLTSGSSGWLADSFLADSGRADAIINYESVLHSMREEGADLEVIVPADGVVSADYPLSTLAQPSQAAAREQVDALAEWLVDNPELVTDTYRRPADASAALPAELADQLLIELPFPGALAVTDTLVQAYNNELRAPGSTVFVLDTSGSMEGSRLDSLQETMLSLIDGTAHSSGVPVGLRDREQVSILPFASRPEDAVTSTYERSRPESQETLSQAVTEMTAEGNTAIYDSLIRAYDLVETAPSVIPSIVLMTDGEVTAGVGIEEFIDFRESSAAADVDVPVFVILYGEANVEEMTVLAQATGGKVFDALNGDLDAAFKEIRAYQ